MPIFDSFQSTNFPLYFFSSFLASLVPSSILVRTTLCRVRLFRHGCPLFSLPLLIALCFRLNIFTFILFSPFCCCCCFFHLSFVLSVVSCLYRLVHFSHRFGSRQQLGFDFSIHFSYFYKKKFLLVSFDGLIN